MASNGFFIRERTPVAVVLYGLYLYFSGLSLRGVSKALEHIFPRSHTAVWLWIQRFGCLASYFKVGRVDRIAIDETWLKVGCDVMWLWLAVEPYRRKILGFYLSRTRNILVAELFLARLKKRYGAKPVYTDGANWYPDACRSLGLSHEVYGDELRSLMERLIQTVKDRTECFDDYFPCRKEHCRLDHIKAWLNIYSVYYNLVRRHTTLGAPPCNPTAQPEYITLQTIANKIRKPLT